MQARLATDPRRGERVASWLGLALGVSFTVCFLTGLYSHFAQHPPSWFTLTARPAGLYRVTQGLHVATGIAAVPLLLAKLWSVYPRLFVWPPVRSVAHALERLSLLPSGRRQHLHALQRGGQHRPLVPAAALLPGRALLGRRG